MREFAELSGTVKREAWEDSGRKALKVVDGKYAGAKRDIKHRFIDMINKLEAHLK